MGPEALRSTAVVGAVVVLASALGVLIEYGPTLLAWAQLAALLLEVSAQSQLPQ